MAKIIIILVFVATNVKFKQQIYIIIYFAFYTILSLSANKQHCRDLRH